MPDQPYDPLLDLHACARGERPALRRLYEAEAPRLLGMVHRLVRDRAMAEDIVHDAFIRIWNRADTFDPSRGDARGWIFSIARHLALNTLRRRNRDVPLPEWEDDTALAEPSPDWQGDAPRLERCLAALEPQRRACILHAYVDGYSQTEIARRLDAPLGTVKAWITRSLKALRECMG